MLENSIPERARDRQSVPQRLPDHHLSVEDQIAEGDKVVTRVTFHRTHRGQFDGIAPTRKQVKWLGTAMDRIADGKVIEM